MKKTMMFVLIAAMLLTTFSGCTKDGFQGTVPTPETQTTATPAEEPAELPSPTEEPTATPEPGPKVYSPADIRGSAELNPFYEVGFPENFYLESVMIHTPGWGDIIGDMVQYHMYYTAPMQDESVRALAVIMGVKQEDEIAGYISKFHEDGRLMFDGYNTAGWRGCVAEIFTTEKDGWEVHLVSEIPAENESRYMKFIEDNYNSTLLADVSANMELLPIPREFKIDTVYIEWDDMMQTSFEAVYRPEDISNILANVVTAGGYSHYDENSGQLSYNYGMLFSIVGFDLNNGTVRIYQQCKGVPDTALNEYEKPITMQDYGLWLSPENGICQHEDHNNGYSNVAFFSTEWGASDSNLTFQFSYPFDQYRVYIWYRPEENIYQISMGKGNSSADYIYDVEKNSYQIINPDKATVDEYLRDIYAGAEVEDLYAQIFRVLEQYTQDFAGISFAELAALPPAEGYAPLALPALPESGGARATLTWLGFEPFEGEYGSYIYRDMENGIDIHLNKDNENVQSDDWNKNVIQQYSQVNGYSLVIAYYPYRGRYEAQMLKGNDPSGNGVQSYFAYDIANNAVLDGDTQGIDMKPEQFFAEALGIEQTDAVFLYVIGIFDQYFANTFGMTPDELFEMDAE